MPDVLDLDVEPASGADVLDLDVEPAAGYSAALAGGGAEGQVRVIGPAGRVAFVAPEAVEGARELGYEVEDLGATIARARGEGLEEAFGGAAGQAEAAARGALRGATFGLSDVALAGGDGDAVGRALAEANPLTSTVSEVVGGVAPGLLSGAPGLVGQVARLTPAGLSAARSAQFVARGGTLLGRGARAALAGATEGAIQGAGDYVGRQALRGDAISGEALAAEALRSGALGGLFGGAFQVGGEGLAAAASRLRRAAGAGDDAAEVGRRALGDAPDAPPLRYSDVLDGRVDDVEDARRALLGSVDDARARRVDDEVAELLQNPVLRNATSGDDGRALRAVERRVRSAAAEFDRARNASSSWATRYQAALDAAPGEDVAARALAVPPELADEGAVQLALLDEARAKLDDVLAGTRQRYVGIAQAPTAAAAGAPGAAPPSGLGARAVRAGEAALGALETAQDLGLPVPTVSKMLGGGAIGEAVGWFLKLKAGARAVAGARGRLSGFLPSTAATRAAASVRATRNRVREALAGSLKPAIVPRARPAMETATVTRVARIARNLAIGASAPDQTERVAQAAHLSAVDADVAAEATGAMERGVQYLAATAPKNPLERTPFADRWRPNAHEVADWERRARVVADPAEAVALIMSDPGAIVEVEALAAVYPRIWADVQAHLAANADALARELSEPQRTFLGNAFQVPLTISQVPGYGSSISLPPPPPQAAPGGPSAPKFGYQPGPSQSPIADLEASGPRRAGR